MKKRYTPQLNPRGDRPPLNPGATWKAERSRGLSTYQMAKRNNPLAEPLPFGQEEDLSCAAVRINHGRFRVEVYRLGWSEARVEINTLRERKARRVVSFFDRF